MPYHDLCPTCARQSTAYGAADLDHGSVVCETSASARWCRAARGRRPATSTIEHRGQMISG